MRILLLILVGLWFAVPGMGQRKMVDLGYPIGAEIDFLSFENDTIGQCNLNSAFVTGEADFYSATFSKEADFHRATFSKVANFFGATFLYKASLHHVTFSSLADFSDATFSSLADFYRTTFSKEADFHRTTFSTNASFSGSTFLEPPNFIYAQLPDTLFLESTNLLNIKTHIFLNLAQVDTLRKLSRDNTRKCTIYLWHTDASKLVIDYDKFRLGFDGFVSLDERIGTYQQVIKKCKDMGMDASATGFDIDMQKLKLENDSFWKWSAPGLIWFQEYWWNFGHERNKILRNTALAFLSSFVLFFIGYRRFFAAYFPADQLGLKADEAIEAKFNRSWSSTGKPSTSRVILDRFKTTFFYTALIFFAWKMDHSKLNYRAYPWTALLVYLIYIIGLIHLAYLAGFVIAR